MGIVPSLPHPESSRDMTAAKAAEAGRKNLFRVRLIDLIIIEFLLFIGRS